MNDADEELQRTALFQQGQVQVPAARLGQSPIPIQAVG